MREDDWAGIFKREFISQGVKDELLSYRVNDCEVVEIILYEKFRNTRDVYLKLMNMKQWW